MPIRLDWETATVRPTEEADLLQVSIPIGSVPDVPLGNLNDALKTLGTPAGPIVSATVSGILIQVSVPPNADVNEVKRALTQLLDRYAEAEERRREIEQSAKINAGRANAGAATAQEMQARFRQP